MSRRRIAALLWLAGGWLFAPAAAAQDGATGSPPERIDLTVRAAPSRFTEEECRRQRETAVVSGEIVVCGAVPGEDQRITSREEAQNRYAAATMGGSTPDVAGPGIFRGPPTFSGLCIKGVLNCPKPPAIFVDVTALPKAPPGSDADRISRGLEPLGAESPASAPPRAELGLPPPPPSPQESAAPAATR